MDCPNSFPWLLPAVHCSEAFDNEHSTKHLEYTKIFPWLLQSVHSCEANANMTPSKKSHCAKSFQYLLPAVPTSEANAMKPPAKKIKLENAWIIRVNPKEKSPKVIKKTQSPSSPVRFPSRLPSREQCETSKHTSSGLQRSSRSDEQHQIYKHSSAKRSQSPVSTSNSGSTASSSDASVEDYNHCSSRRSNAQSYSSVNDHKKRRRSPSPSYSERLQSYKQRRPHRSQYPVTTSPHSDDRSKYITPPSPRARSGEGRVSYNHSDSGSTSSRSAARYESYKHSSSQRSGAQRYISRNNPKKSKHSSSHSQTGKGGIPITWEFQ